MRDFPSLDRALESEGKGLQDSGNTLWVYMPDLSLHMDHRSNLHA